MKHNRKSYNKSMHPNDAFIGIAFMCRLNDPVEDSIFTLQNKIKEDD